MKSAIFCILNFFCTKKEGGLNKNAAILKVVSVKWRCKYTLKKPNFEFFKVVVKEYIFKIKYLFFKWQHFMSHIIMQPKLNINLSHQKEEQSSDSIPPHAQSILQN